MRDGRRTEEEMLTPLPPRLGLPHVDSADSDPATAFLRGYGCDLTRSPRGVMRITFLKM